MTCNKDSCCREGSRGARAPLGKTIKSASGHIISLRDEPSPVQKVESAIGATFRADTASFCGRSSVCHTATESSPSQRLEDAMKKPVKPVESRKMMGIGPLGDSNVIFARKFRWTLEGEGLPEYFVKNVTIDYTAKTLAFDYMDVASSGDGFHALKWAKALADTHAQQTRPSGSLLLTTYDGCGGVLYKVTFHGLTILSHKSNFDYASSEESVQHIVVGFDRWDYDVHEVHPIWSTPAPAAPKKEEYPWVLHVDYAFDWIKSFKLPCKIDQPPTMRCEEQEVTRMGVAVYRPVKQIWRDIKVTLPSLTQDQLKNLITEVRNYAFKATISRTVAEAGTEVNWVLLNAKFRCESADDKKTVLVLSYDFAQFHSKGADND